MNSVVLITGASTGFGRLAAETLSRRGYTVFATMRDIAGRNALNRDELVSFAAANNLRLTVLELDVTEDASVERAAQSMLQQAGRVDVVINNAGFGNIGVTEAYTIEQFQTLFDTNVYGPLRVNRAVLPLMRRQRSGLLIHVTSVAGRVSVPYMAPYCASKFALEAIAEAYRFELSAFGIDSVVVEPGVFKTPIFGKVFVPADTPRVSDYGAANYSQRVVSTFDAAISAPEAPDPAEVIDAFVTLIELPAGQRPFRTVVGAGVQPLLQPHNEASEQITLAFNQIFNLPELMPEKKTRTAGS